MHGMLSAHLEDTFFCFLGEQQQLEAADAAVQVGRAVLGLCGCCGGNKVPNWQDGMHRQAPQEARSQHTLLSCFPAPGGRAQAAQRAVVEPGWRQHARGPQAAAAAGGGAGTGQYQVNLGMCGNQCQCPARWSAERALGINAINQSDSSIQ